jgi:uncharacterized membrane protein
MDSAHTGAAPGFVLVARRNNSLSRAGRYRVFGSLVIVSLGISLTFALHGAWPVVPFAGAEMLVLYLAFRAVERHARDFESVSVSGDRVVLERWESGRVSRAEFSRYWAQVVFEPSSAGGHALLAVRSHGRQVQFGRHLTDEQRREAARTLKHQLSRHAHSSQALESGGSK